MRKSMSAIEEDARKLGPVERLALVDAILNSLDEPDQEIDQLWSQEAEGRLAAYRRGEIQATPLNEVLAKYRTP